MQRIAADNPRSGRRASADDGIVLPLAALFMVVLVIVVAIVVDLGNARQEQRQAQAVADAAALSGAASLSDPSPDASLVAITYAFKSLALTPPANHAALASCGTNCLQYAGSGKTVQAYTSWQGNSNWVHVEACWNVPTSFARIMNSNNINVCGKATAINTGAGNGPGGPPSSSCTTNEFTTTVHNPIGTPGTGEDNQNGNGNGGNGGGVQPAVVLSAKYSATAPIDPNSIVFIAPNSLGNLVKLTPAQYTLTITGNTATISYTVPSGLSTATASLFATDINGTDCGELAWSSCPVSLHDNFIESAGGGIADQGMKGTDSDADESMTAAQLADAALIADADDAISPAPGVAVGPGSTLGATYHDETDISKTKSQLFLGGVTVAPTFTTLTPGSGANAFIYTMAYTLPISTPNGWNSVLLYFWDADVTATGGDCALAQWAFKFTGGGAVNLIQ
jgi:Flp pilus assembly protein TadG